MNTNPIIKSAVKKKDDHMIPILQREGNLPDAGFRDGTGEKHNKLTRDVVVSYVSTYGDKTRVGVINRYGKDNGSDKSFFWKPRPYHPFVYTFEVAFVIPEEDQRLHDLLKGREDAPYTGTAADWVWVTKIINRIEEIGGEHLSWC